MATWGPRGRRTLPMLRSPAPYRHATVLLALATAFAAFLVHVPALLDRARLAAGLFAATAVRIDPVTEYSMSGRWPAESTVPVTHSTADQRTDVQTLHVTHDGVALTIARGSDRVRLELNRELTRGGALRWHCRVRPVTIALAVAPMSLPAVCRE